MASHQKQKRPFNDFESDLETNLQKENFPKFLTIKSLEEKAVTSLSPFVIEKQIQSLIGTPKTVWPPSTGALEIGGLPPLWQSLSVT